MGVIKGWCKIIWMFSSFLITFSLQKNQAIFILHVVSWKNTHKNSSRERNTTHFTWYHVCKLLGKFLCNTYFQQHQGVHVQRLDWISYWNIHSIPEIRNTFVLNLPISAELSAHVGVPGSSLTTPLFKYTNEYKYVGDSSSIWAGKRKIPGSSTAVDKSWKMLL